MTYIYKSPLQELDGEFKVTDGLITGATNVNWDDAYAKRVDVWVHPLLYSENEASLDTEDSGIRHGGLAGLLVDDHAQYFADTTIGVRAKDYSTTGIITAGTFTDGTATLIGGDLLGLTSVCFNFSATSQYCIKDDSQDILSITNTVSGQATGLRLYTQDGNLTKTAEFAIHGVGTIADRTDRELLVIQSTTVDDFSYDITTKASGTGTIRPLALYTDGSSQILLRDGESMIFDGNIDWTGVSEIDLSDAGKVVRIASNNSSALNLIDESARPYLEIRTITGSEVIRFGNTGTNPDFNFLGTGPTTFSGNILVNGGFIGDTALPGLIELNGSVPEVTVHGDLTVDDNIDLAVTTPDVGQITQNGNRIFHTYVPSDQPPTWPNIFIGEDSGSFTLENLGSPIEGTGNVGVGADTLADLTTGFFNFALGTNSGSSLTSGSANVLVGHQAGLNITTGASNVMIGRDAGALGNMGSCVGIGQDSLRNSGSNCVGIGFFTGRSFTGTGSIFLGYGAGWKQTTTPNILLVSNLLQADAATELTNSIIYGIMAATPAAQILRFNAVTNITQNVRIGDTTTPEYALEVAGVVKSESGRVVKTTRLTADGTTLSTAHHEVFCNTDGGAFTVTLPATPVGQTYRITNSGNNNLTLGRNGNNIKGSATDATVPSGDTLIITWEPTEGWW